MLSCARFPMRSTARQCTYGDLAMYGWVIDSARPSPVHRPATRPHSRISNQRGSKEGRRRPPFRHPFTVTPDPIHFGWVHSGRSRLCRSRPREAEEANSALFAYNARPTRRAHLCGRQITLAGVAELVDALDSKSSSGNRVWVRFPPPAPMVRQAANAVERLDRSAGEAVEASGKPKAPGKRARAA